MMKRLLFATSAMHAYGHQWACQLVYNPRLRVGLGLTEGEGTERVWSKFRMLIGVTRSSGVRPLPESTTCSLPEMNIQRTRRIWLLDRHADVVNAATRRNLGSWIRGRLKNSVQARTARADQHLAKIDVSVSELRKEWENQREAQLSVRNRKHMTQTLFYSSCRRSLLVRDFRCTGQDQARPRCSAQSTHRTGFDRPAFRPCTQGTY